MLLEEQKAVGQLAQIRTLERGVRGRFLECAARRSRETMSADSTGSRAGANHSPAWPLNRYAAQASTDPRVSYHSLRTAWSVLFEFLNPIQRRKYRANHLDHYIGVRRSDHERTTARGEKFQQRGGRSEHD